jgi:hypothetical protein
MTSGRRQRFLTYFNDGPLKGNREALIRRTGLTKGRISQLFDEKQPFGERAAMALAEKLGLPAAYFERDQAVHDLADEPTLSADELQLLQDMRELLPEDRERVAEEVRSRAEQMRKHATLVLERAGVTSVASDARVAKHIQPAPKWNGEERRREPHPVAEDHRRVYFTYGGDAPPAETKRRSRR